MSAIVKETIRRLLITICMMWLWDTRENVKCGDWFTYFVQSDDFDFKDERLKDKRIQIEFKIIDIYRDDK